MSIQPLESICNREVPQNFAGNFLLTFIAISMTKVAYFFVLIIFVKEHAIVIAYIDFNIWHMKTI